MKSQKLAALREGELLGSVGQKAEVTQAHEAIGEYVEEESANKLLGVKGHRFQPVFVPSVPVAMSNQNLLAAENSF